MASKANKIAQSQIQIEKHQSYSAGPLVQANLPDTGMLG